MGFKLLVIRVHSLPSYTWVITGPLFVRSLNKFDRLFQGYIFRFEPLYVPWLCTNLFILKALYKAMYQGDVFF